MADSMIRFLICNLFISGMIGILLIVKQLLKNSLTSRMKYNLWFLLLGLLAVPFMPLRPIGLPQILSWLTILKSSSASNAGNMIETAHAYPSGISNQINDFTVSVSRGAPSIIGLILCGIWIVGIFAMLLLIIRSMHRLNTLKRSALPLQNKEVRRNQRNLETAAETYCQYCFL